MGLIMTFGLLGCMFTLSGQSFQYLSPYGFNCSVLDGKKLNSGRWVLAIESISLPGGILRDTLSLVFLDSLGTFEKRIVVIPPNPLERLDFLWMEISDEDEVYIGYAGGACDVLNHPLNLFKYSLEGNLLWAKRNMDIDTPDDFRLSTAYGILITKDDWMYSLSPENGDILWQTGVGLEWPGYNTIISDSADLLYFESDSMYLAYLDSIEGHLQYIIKARRAINFDYNFFDYLTIAPDHTLYTYSGTDGGIIQIDHNLNFQLLIPLNEEPLEFHYDQGSFWILPIPDMDHEYASHFIQYDTSGILIRTYPYFQKNLYIPHFSVHNSNITGFGYNFSGIHYSNPDLTPHEYRYQGWMMSSGIDQLGLKSDSMNVAISNIRQDAGISIDSIWDNSPPPGKYVYTFHGGDFSIEVTNHGSKTVQSVWLNTGFEVKQGIGICNGEIAAMKVYYRDLDIKPGESAWLSFGDINASNQTNYLSEFCFWTSGPNHTPDIQPEDDLFCYQLSVPVIEITSNGFLLYPNPTTGSAHIEVTQAICSQPWRVLNVDGALLINGLLPGVPGSYTIEMGDFPPGIYLLRIGNEAAKLVIAK